MHDYTQVQYCIAHLQLYRSCTSYNTKQVPHSIKYYNDIAQQHHNHA